MSGNGDGIMTSDQHDPLETAWRNASSDLIAEEAFLRELAGRSVLVILYQPPGPGAAAPERNFVQWQHQATGNSFVPIFTDTSHLTIPIPAPAQAVRVPMRVLLAAGDGKGFVINPLSSSRFELDETGVAKLRAFIEARSQESEAPSQHAPWAFRLPDDALYPVAVSLVEWFNANGRVDEAYLYELTRGEASPVVVLGLNDASDPDLARTLTAVAVASGASPNAFVVRFLPDEASHRAGIEGIKLEPFYCRP
jgi:hypothetical protein